MESRDHTDEPLRPDARFSVEVARFLDGRPDPSRNVAPRGNAPLDVLAVLAAQEQLDRIIG